MFYNFKYIVNIREALNLVPPRETVLKVHEKSFSMGWCGPQFMFPYINKWQDRDFLYEK